jgi:biopolymer transport protein ExbD
MVRLPKWCLGLLALVLVLGLAMPALAAETKGKIKSVDAEKAQMVVTDQDNKEWTFNVDKDAKVLVNDKESKLADLKADDEVTITHEKKGGKFIASEIRCARK